MRKPHIVSAGFFVTVLVGVACASTEPVAAMSTAPIQEKSEPVKKSSYPVSKVGDVVDDLHGTRVPDPYRWLEDPDAPDTVSWVQAQNAVTFGWLGKVATRDAMKQRLTTLWNSCGLLEARAPVPVRVWRK
jgi:prolyl oligopeptidase